MRTVLTVLAVAVAFLLFGVMHGVVSSFDSALDRMSDTRLRVISRANMLETLPIAYRERLQSIDGVTVAVPLAIFLGYYQNPRNNLNAIGMNVREFVSLIPEIKVPEEALARLDNIRTGAVAGFGLVKRLGWQVGDRIPLKSLMWANAETGQDWTFDLVGIVNGGPDDDEVFAQEMYVRYDYLDEARTTGKGRVHQFIVGIDAPEHAERIAREADAMFANSPDETKTLNEKQYLQNQLAQLGDIQSLVYYILAAVLFALLFMTATNMMQSIRERMTDLGIMRALGFSGGTLAVLVMIESTVLSLLGALIGLALAAGIFPLVFASFGIQGITLRLPVFLQGLGIAVALALAASCWPAWRTASLNVVEAITAGQRG